MSDSRFDRLADIVPEALALPTVARDAFLDRVCARPDGTPDPDLRGEAAALVAASDAADASGALAPPVRAAASADLPDAVGPWRVTGLLGEGGMGVVYRAERADGLFERTVALKRIRPDLAHSLAGRLDAERHALARLEHDGIARLYDGGVSAQGVAYVVMELADGLPITEHADAAGLDTAARVRLFAPVCDAVAYAHARLVVHRDLKPSNVFVTPGGRPKLLDFGIAKILGDAGGETDASAATRTHASMTPTYAAPEQLRRGDVTTASDVYALGVMLYELLAGRRPYSLAGASPAEAERIVCETVPPPPSQVAPPDRARAVRGDLDTICLKALAKEPERRYASAEALAVDLRRHLGGLPVLARPATRRYRAGRFVRRHRTGVAAALLVAVALVGGAGVALWQARAARAEAARAEAVNAFLTDLLASADPGEDGRDVRVVSLLEAAGATLDSVFAGQPDVAAAMRHTLGTTYLGLGLYGEADSLLTLALAARERIFGPSSQPAAQTLTELGYLRLEQNRLGAADSLLTRALGTMRALGLGQDFDVAEILSNLAYVRFLDGDFDASVALHRESVDVLEAQPVPDSLEIAIGLSNVAIVLDNQGRAAEAVPILERQVALVRRVLGPDHARTARALNNLSTSLYRTGRFDDARRASMEAVAVFREAVGGDNAELAGALSNLAPPLLALDRPDDAAAALDEAIAAFDATRGPDHPRTLAARIKLGGVREAQGRPAEAETLYRNALARLRTAVPADHPLIGVATVELGTLLATSGRAAGAVPLLREGLTVRQAALPAAHPDIAVAQGILGDALVRTGAGAEAERLLRTAVAGLAGAARSDSTYAERRHEAVRNLVDLRRGRAAQH